MSEGVKSAVRVLKILEHFDGIRRPAGVVEIARTLGYPPSSTKALLHSLVELGYLVQDEQRLYRPTPRVTLLGTWVDPWLAPGGPVVSMMDELNAATGETIILGIPSGFTVRYIHVVPATKPMRLHVGPGETRSMALSGIGRIFMARMSDEEVRNVVFRHNALVKEEGARLSIAAVRRDIESIRATGYSVSIDRFSTGAGLVAVALDERPESVPMGVAVAGLSTSIRSTAPQLAQLMRQCMSRHLAAAASPKLAVASRRPR